MIEDLTGSSSQAPPTDVTADETAGMMDDRTGSPSQGPPAVVTAEGMSVAVMVMVPVEFCKVGLMV